MEAHLTCNQRYMNKGRVVPFPKSEDPGDPNKWIGVTLMYMGSKIFSSILCTRLFKIIKLHGVKYQFGSTPGVWCQDDRFTIKTILHLRQAHNLPTWVLFENLVKAFDTSNHVLIIKVLERYGSPPNLQSAIYEQRPCCPLSKKWRPWGSKQMDRSYPNVYGIKNI